MVVALENIPKLGRRKITIGGKPHGRNELIGHYIRLATGKERSRKQISSHIQVIKGKMKNHPNCEYYNSGFL
jgi:transcriptional enhancer factor